MRKRFGLAAIVLLVLGLGSGLAEDFPARGSLLLVVHDGTQRKERTAEFVMDDVSSLRFEMSKLPQGEGGADDSRRSAKIKIEPEVGRELFSRATEILRTLPLQARRCQNAQRSISLTVSDGATNFSITAMGVCKPSEVHPKLPEFLAMVERLAPESVGFTIP